MHCAGLFVIAYLVYVDADAPSRKVQQKPDQRESS
ncbi:hypothetical protein ABIE64_003402 [Thalassospira sp. MBR-102]|jgi:hypothetical protein|uniref:Uncharacterized protein n=1 Tax=Thalassospira permensis NBRC 106175 TaxID=1353532 RepID=A0ABR4TT41_9PROT|nr:hypothetical protein SMB34_13965 [Thalassospira permensis NBRC 106175]OCK07547.1 hypothetical protein KO164_1725 [Thalassospira sp. KO164]PXX33114.1 hypothetical protein C7967_10324 [Thalassospira sp. 11-3]SEE13705.1 hypothetical protein SAMN04515623_1738 [Thalassospira permensis]SIS74379.1 hypothetical protein SAMN02744133_102117 [Thalassospira xiamenensis M-5 = DSM 17429]|tara:strand:- start:987 stop:1091 length:105 start_codon:yes stop_codon:yes gene_type:complete